MSPPRRRSSRLRGSSATPAKSFVHANRLDALAERDETPTSGPQSNLDDVVASPMPPHTPATAGRIKPALEEMHPSKTHQSTTEQPDSGLRLGFTDIDTSGSNLPSGVKQKTPSKTGISSTFDFRFARPGPQLGPEAQRMMEELREDAARIKAKLAAEQEEAKRKKAENTSISSRKIAQPKGKAGRYSDVHMAEFKKMDSIAGHPSSFRALPKTPSSQNLKRTQSKANLDDREAESSKRDQPNRSGRLENTAPAKRARQHIADDASTARPVSRDTNSNVKSLPSTPTHQRSHSSFLSSITTPTQASLARAASLNKSSAQIPTLSRSPSKPTLATPGRLRKTATVGSISSTPKSKSKVTLRSPGKLDRVKSALRYPGFSSKKEQASSSIARSTTGPDLDKGLPSLPSTPHTTQRSKNVKHVNFTPDTMNKHGATVQHSPSPVKSGIPRSISRTNLSSAAELPNSENQGHISKAMGVNNVSIDNLSGTSNDVEYPSLAGVRPLPKVPQQSNSYPAKSQSQLAPPNVISEFTFRCDNTVGVGGSPKGFGSSAGQASIRQVRPSMPGSFPTGNKENKAPIPSVPHGMSNKKRRRAGSDDSDEEDFERSPKKQKSGAPEGNMLMAPRLMAENLAPPSRIPSPEKKKGLSLSRLNMLARPKARK
ncbi:hypothetical protein BP6252_07912 [Coleophoma cylindrospora]|uniref:Erythromycin esterase n=1 Tax=Coleophoma cylindrospora TaxID=1849047 RepID=A0A3D8RBB6_9HELO|nr:hypothetical protein BP6252_07912 [Coleophoma cylindrospora]